MAEKLTIDVVLNPKIDAAAFEKIVGGIKSSLGDLGGSVKFDGAAFSGLTAGAQKATEETEKLVKAGSGLERAFKFNMITQAATQAANALSGVISVGNEYEATLAAVGAVTGQSGDGLEKLGVAARELGKEFGTGASSNLKSFQGILSKFGPQVAENSEALKSMGESVNLLSASSGDAADVSMSALTDTMLQLGIVSGDAAKDADTMRQVADALAASAKVGAAEVPQVSQAILQAGVAAKGANLGLEQTTAAIQVLAVGGKTGAEAGIALRNVLGLMQKASGPAADTLKKLGVTSQELGETLTTKGLGPALDLLKKGMGNLSTDTERNNALMTIFGMENANAAGILLDNSSKLEEYTKGINAAVVAGASGADGVLAQASVRLGTASSMASRIKAFVEDGFISVQGFLGTSLSAVIQASAQIGPTLATLLNIGKIIPEGMVGKVGEFAVSLVQKLVPSLFTTVAANGTATFSFSALWAAATGPVGLVIAALAAVATGVYFLVDALSVSAEEQLEEAEAQKALVNEQIAANDQRKKSVSSTQDLVREFEKLATKTGRTKDETARLRTVQNELDKQYPDLIDQTKTFSENLQGVADIGRRTSAEMSKLTETGKQLAAQLSQSDKIIAASKRNIAIEELRDVLGATKFFDTLDGKGTKFRQEWLRIQDAFAQKIYTARTEEDLNNAENAVREFINAAATRADIGVATEDFTDIFGKISTVVGSARAALEAYGTIKKEVEKPPTTPDPIVKTKAEETSKIKSYTEEIARALEESNRIREEVAAQLVIDEEERTLAALKAKQQSAVDQVNAEIRKAQALKVGEEISANDRAALVAALGKKLESVEIRNAAELESTKAKLATDRFKRERDRSKNERDERISLAQAELASFSDLDDLQNDKRIEAIEKVGAARLVVLRATAEKEKENAIESTAFVKEAFDALIKALSSGDDAAIAKASDDLADARVKALEDPRVVNAIAKANKAEADSITANANAIKKAKIESEQDTAVRTRDLAVFNAQLAYEEQKKQARGNADDEFAAFVEFLDKKKAAEENYLNATDSIYVVSNNFRRALEKVFTSGADEESRKRYDELVGSLNEEEAAIEASVEKQTKTYEEASIAFLDVASKRRDALTELADPTPFEKLLEGLSVGFAETSEQFTTRANAAYEEYLKIQEKEGVTSTEIAEKRTKALEEQAIASAAALGQMAASGKATAEDFGNFVLDQALNLLTKQIPVWVAGIFGTTVASLGLAGLAVASGLTVALYGLVGAAKAALGRATGEVRIRGRGTRTSDDNPRLLSVDESVLTANATLATGNEAAFLWANKTGRPLSEYYAKKVGGNVFYVEHIANDDPKVARKFDEMSRQLQEQNETLQRIAAYTSRDKFGAVDQNLNVTLDRALVAKEHARDIQIINAGM